VTRGFRDLSCLSHRPGHDVREAGAEIEKNGDQLQLADLLRALRPFRGPSAQIESEYLNEQPRREQPAEIVGQRHTKIGAALVPYPDFVDRRFGWIHHQIPLRHDKSRNDGQSDKV
jgi:hypothetical protein